MPEAHSERRRMTRCDMQEAVTVKFWEHGPREIPGVAQNASPDGVFFSTGRPLPERTQVDLVFLFPATLSSPGVRFVCRCKILRSEADTSSGNFGFAAAIVRSESERISFGHSSAMDIYETGLVPAD